MTIIDRRGIIVGEEEPAASRYAHSGLALKAPVACATTTNITLSGLQTLDGVTTVADDRVLVKDQTDATENGVYIASTGNWTRAGDFDGAGEIAYGTRVFVTGGTTQALSDWYVSSPNPITVGSTDINLTEVVSGGAPASVSYVVLGASEILPSERVLAVGSGVTLTDGGAGASITVGLDPTLVAIAGQAPGADQAIYFTGADTVSLFTLTSAARSLLDDATVAAMRGTLEFATSTTDNGIARFDGTSGGTQTSLWLIDDSGNLCPVTTDTGWLGTSSLMVSGAYFASGAAINFNNGDVILTHSANTLTLFGGVLEVPTAGLQVGASVPFSDTAGLLTLQNVDALDATTEATIEAAIDTLANLTSIQGQTVTINGSVTLNDWFNQSVKTTASPEFAAVTVGGSNVLVASGLGSTTQAYNARLADIAGITFAQGDILYFNGSNLAKLAAGASGQYLKTQGAGANPVWDSVSGGGSGRELLTANRTYYVRTDGSDSNTGLSNTSGGAFLTLQKAADVIAASLDIATFTVTVQVGAGTYTAGVTVPAPWAGTGNVEFVGDTTTPSNVVISVTGGHCFQATDKGRLLAKGFKTVTTTSGFHLVARRGAYIRVTGNWDFGACPTNHAHVYSNFDALVTVGNSTDSGGAGVNYTISGDAPYHFIADDGGHIQMEGGTVTASGTRAFTTFANAWAGGHCRSHSMTYSGTFTGKRYDTNLNGVITGSAVGANYFPGNSAGTTATGGQYGA